VGKTASKYPLSITPWRQLRKRPQLAIRIYFCPRLAIFEEADGVCWGEWGRSEVPLVLLKLCIIGFIDFENLDRCLELLCDRYSVLQRARNLMGRLGGLF
jgi:hypothetical protein